MIDDEISVGSTTLAVRRGSEYSEEINRLELSVVNVLQQFKNSSIVLPHLLTMLNVLLKKEMEKNPYLADIRIC